MNKKILSLLSICRKAGMLSTGEFSCEKALQLNQSKLILIASDSSNNTKKKFINKSFYYKVPSFVFETKDIMGKSIGKVNISVVSINDEGFAGKIKSYFDILENNEDNKSNSIS